ncbi:MAG: cadherin-like beta sandwich domain-containing protein [Firmicutes bacterium]|nr:cadherin-like beta sandwich domain-containing protein [Bacillota bacterium]
MAADWKVVSVDGKTKSDVNNLSALKLSGLTLSPAFAAGTTSYTATAATGGTSMIYAAPADAGATMLIKLGSTVKNNGDELTWAAGSNSVTVKVTPEDGGTAKTYTITVTAS